MNFWRVGVTAAAVFVFGGVARAQCWDKADCVRQIEALEATERATYERAERKLLQGHEQQADEDLALGRKLGHELYRLRIQACYQGDSWSCKQAIFGPRPDDIKDDPDLEYSLEREGCLAGGRGAATLCQQAGERAMVGLGARPDPHDKSRVLSPLPPDLKWARDFFARGCALGDKPSCELAVDIAKWPARRK